MHKQSIATFLSTLANAARNTAKGVPLRTTAKQNFTVAAGTTSLGAGPSALLAEAAGGTAAAHGLAQLTNAGSSFGQAAAGTLLGRYGANTEFVKRLVARQAAKAAKAAPNTVRKVSRNVGLTSV
jgi:hypothetical protein